MRVPVLVPLCVLAAAFNGWTGEQQAPEKESQVVCAQALVLGERLIATFPAGDERDDAWCLLADAYGGLNPAKGLALFPNVKDSRKLEFTAIRLCGHYARALIRRDGIEAALKTINALEFGSLRHLAWTALGEEWGKRDVEKAAQ